MLGKIEYGGFYSPGYGAGIYNSGTATLDNCLVSGNRTIFDETISGGGGIYN